MRSLAKIGHILIGLLIAMLPVRAQKVSWTAEAQPAEEGLWTVCLQAKVISGWHIYDLQDYKGEGPNQTVIAFEPSGDYALEGEMEISPAPDRHFDAMYGMVIGTFDGTVRFVQKVRPSSLPITVGVNVEWMACTAQSCTPPEEQHLEVVISSDETLVADCSSSVSGSGKSSRSLWAMIIEAILWGFAALLTPCVFPMVPMTVSFFLKGSDNKAAGRFKAAMYGLFIVLLYTVPIAIIILLTRIIGGDAVTADIFNWLATHWLPNIVFFLVFMVFAASFFGAFELVLPSSLVNSSDQQADKRKGLGGVFFLALTLVLVSFSCTGPIVGTVLIKSTTGEFWAPIVTMLAFSLAFSLPFVLCALFPTALKKLPKSGGWLNSVKVVLGFVEIALGLKFLSTADQVYHWGLLDREVYLAIWIVCFTLLGFYLLGKLRFKGDDEVRHINFFRLALAIIDFSFVVYMVPGMWGAPLKALSGYLPPMHTQDFVLETYQSGVRVVDAQSSDSHKYSDVLTLPYGLDGYFDLTEAEEASRRTGKPLFIDFTGHGCVNCREMEVRVWSDAQVLGLLSDKFIICALYTDDKMPLPENEWVVTPSGKTLKTLGKVNAHIALERYGVNAQPNYVIQAPDGRILCPARGYDLDIPSFVSWLNQAL